MLGNDLVSTAAQGNLKSITKNVTKSVTMRASPRGLGQKTARYSESAPCSAYLYRRV
jgi:hypothetical protein